MNTTFHARAAALALAAALAAGAPAHAEALPVEPAASAAAAKRSAKRKATTPRFPGPVQVGTASYYGRKFFGRRMADGTPMRPDSDNAASRTLPLGTTALVTNLRNGRTAVVTIRDRGPFVAGRIIDVSPSTARQLGFVEAGLARVEVVPVSAPLAGVTTRVALAERLGEE